LRSRGFAQFKVQDAFGVFKAASRRSRRFWRVQGRFAAFKAPLACSRPLRGVQGAFGAFKVQNTQTVQKKENFYWPGGPKRNVFAVLCDLRGLERSGRLKTTGRSL
jgi:hypothetical protein